MLLLNACSGMDLKVCIYVLLCAASTALPGVCGESESRAESRWARQSLPGLQATHTAVLHTPSFQGREEEEDRGRREVLCGIECQSKLPLIDRSEQERILGYQTMYENGTCTHTDVSLEAFNETTAKPSAISSGRTRRRRQVYGADGRFVISDSHFITNYPFSTAVCLSTGCSGVLISPKHVLTAARCIHDGDDYLESTRKLKVGVLQLKTKRRRGGRRRGGQHRDGREEEGQTGEETGGGPPMEEGEEKNSIDGDVVRGRNRGEGGKRRGRRGHDGEVKRKGRGKGKRLSRKRRSAAAKKEPAFRWARVKQTQIPQGWLRTKSSSNPLSSDYDYAVLELKRPVKQKHMELGVAPSAAALARIHFSGYDADKGGDEKVVYRFCSVAKQSDDLMYQHCDAQDGARGAGIYVRLRQEAGRKGKWQRRVIGVFSGHRWVEEDGGEQKDFNVAVRITPPKYAQICYWIHGDPSLCKEI
ncbi:serine protease 23-like [Salarias fasciatus]|uniref:Inactive serine protease 35 n=1 Tax=Salarias fasciatus TaxID=181472 RepID=A0A672H4D9_SALFA|nr:serine protease 23-like [Salarias fasciatus]